MNIFVQPQTSSFCAEGKGNNPIFQCAVASVAGISQTVFHLQSNAGPETLLM